MKFKKWFRRVSLLKYPAVLLVAISGLPALELGVSGYRSTSGLFISKRSRRINLNQIDLRSNNTPSWCVQTHVSLEDADDITHAECGFNSEQGRLAREMTWDEPWNGWSTNYSLGNILDSSPSIDEADFRRDWRWFEFFYGYGPLSKIGAALLQTVPAQMNAGIVAVLAFFSFIIFDTFVLTFMLVRFLINMIKQ